METRMDQMCVEVKNTASNIAELLAFMKRGVESPQNGRAIFSNEQQSPSNSPCGQESEPKTAVQLQSEIQTSHNETSSSCMFFLPSANVAMPCRSLTGSATPPSNSESPSTLTTSLFRQNAKEYSLLASQANLGPVTENVSEDEGLAPPAMENCHPPVVASPVVLESAGPVVPEADDHAPARLSSPVLSSVCETHLQIVLHLGLLILSRPRGSRAYADL